MPSRDAAADANGNDVATCVDPTDQLCSSLPMTWSPVRRRGRDFRLSDHGFVPSPVVSVRKGPAIEKAAALSRHSRDRTVSGSAWDPI